MFGKERSFRRFRGFWGVHVGFGEKYLPLDPKIPWQKWRFQSLEIYGLYIPLKMRISRGFPWYLVRWVVSPTNWDVSIWRFQYELFTPENEGFTWVPMVSDFAHHPSSPGNSSMLEGQRSWKFFTRFSMAAQRQEIWWNGCTLPETNSSHQKKKAGPLKRKETIVFLCHPFSGGNWLLVSGRVWFSPALKTDFFHLLDNPPI